MKHLFRGVPKNRTAYIMNSTMWKENCKGGFVFGSLVESDDKCFICLSVRVNPALYTVNTVASMIEVIPETVGECTGVKDSEGVLIYEHDIVEEGCNRLRSYVVRCPESASYRLKDLGPSYSIEDAPLEWAVIGTIHDDIIKETIECNGK